MESQNGLIIATTTDVVSLLAADAEKAQQFVADSKSQNTRMAYASDWKHFDEWCLSRGVASLPAQPEVVGLYLAAHGDELKPSTLARRIAAIAVKHRDANLPNPASMKHGAVADVLRGIRRTRGTAQQGKGALVVEDMQHLMAVLPNRGVIGQRDAALLLLGFCGAFRRSELAGLLVEDLAFSAKGLEVTLVRSKTDQEGAGRVVAIPHQSNPTVCPVHQLKAWLERGKVESGPVFRAVDRHGNVSKTAMTAQSVRLVVMNACERAGLDSSRFSAHSLRSGFVTSALIAGKGETAVMAQTGHKSAATMRRYYRNLDLFKHNAAEGLL